MKVIVYKQCELCNDRHCLIIKHIVPDVMTVAVVYIVYN